MRFVRALAGWLLIAAGPISAQDLAPVANPTGEPAAEYKEGKLLRAHRLTGTPPDIDGRLDDVAWQGAPSAEGLVQWEPDNMAPLSERTVIQVAYDDRYVYIGVRCYDREHAGNLLETLRAYFDAVGDINETGRRLELHPNTVRYRLRRVEEVADLRLNDPDERLLAELQVRLLIA